MVEREHCTDSSERKGDAFLLLSDDELINQCAVDTYRASGPGGQKRNKTSSAVRLRHGPTGLAAISEESRSQHVNKARATRRLRENIALAIRSEIAPDAYKPSGLLRSYVNGGGQFRVSETNRDYALVICEVLDVMAASEMRLSDTAGAIGITTAQLGAFLRKDAKLWERVNQMRRAAGTKPLR